MTEHDDQRQVRRLYYRGVDGLQILPDGRRPIRFVIRDTLIALIADYPNIFPFGKAWTERWVR